MNSEDLLTLCFKVRDFGYKPGRLCTVADGSFVEFICYPYPEQGSIRILAIPAFPVELTKRGVSFEEAIAVSEYELDIHADRPGEGVAAWSIVTRTRRAA